VLDGHKDSVWGLAYSAAHHRLASCSADGSVRIWDPQGSSPCLSVFNKEKGMYLIWIAFIHIALLFKRTCRHVYKWILQYGFCGLGRCCVCLFIYFFLERGTPTSVAFVTSDPNQVVVSFDCGDTLLYDLNTEQSIIGLETQTKDGENRFPPVTPKRQTWCIVAFKC